MSLIVGVFCFRKKYSIMLSIDSVYNWLSIYSRHLNRKEHMTHLFVYRLRNASDLEAWAEVLTGVYDKTLYINQSYRNHIGPSRPGKFSPSCVFHSSPDDADAESLRVYGLRWLPMVEVK